MKDTMDYGSALDALDAAERHLDVQHGDAVRRLRVARSAYREVARFGEPERPEPDMTEPDLSFGRSVRTAALADAEAMPTDTCREVLDRAAAVESASGNLDMAVAALGEPLGSPPGGGVRRSRTAPE
jgi:hypothetical protein